MLPFKWIFFDLFDTLVYINEEIYYAGKKESAEITGIDPDEFMKAWKETAEDALVGILRDPFQRATKALEIMGIKDRAIAAKISLYDVETLQRCVSFYDGATETLALLREKGLSLALLSNATATTAFILNTLHLRDRFDVLVFSYEIGVKKPSYKFFEKAIERTKSQPFETLFVGDGANRELDSAKEMGFETVKIVHPKKAATFIEKELLSSDSHYTVSSFSELIKYLQL
jgi:HAD superfamily hydrolase (TIGR01509 family)